jgi:PhnB protein
MTSEQMTSVERVPTRSTASVVPYLRVKDAKAAIDFYKKAFGARESPIREMAKDGKVGYAEIMIGDALIMLSDEFPEQGVLGPESLGGSAVLLVLLVDDVHRVSGQAVSAGAKLIRPVQEETFEFSGGPEGKGQTLARASHAHSQVEDPFGYRWDVGTVTNTEALDALRKRATL